MAAVEKGYLHKYDHTNPGTRYVFDRLYNKLASMGLATSMTAVPGRDIERYLGYGAALAKGSSKSILTLMENDADCHRNIMDRLMRPDNKAFIAANNIRVRYMLGDIFTYEKEKTYPFTNQARVEDYGIGIGHRELMAKVAGRLYKQQRTGGNIRDRWKAIITDSAIRQIPKEQLFHSLQAYLDLGFGQHIGIVSVNGIDATDPCNHHRCFAIDNADVIFEYRGKPKHKPNTNEFSSQGQRGAVRRYDVVLESNNRFAKLFVFTCKNGSEMMQTMIVYK